MVEEIMNELEIVQKDLSKIIEENKFEEDMSDLLSLRNVVLGSKEIDNKIRNFKKYYRDNIYMNQDNKYFKNDKRFDDLEIMCELLKEQNNCMSLWEKAMNDMGIENIVKDLELSPNDTIDSFKEENKQEEVNIQESEESEAIKFNGLLGDIINNKEKKPIIKEKKEIKVEKIDANDKKKLDVLNQAIDKWENKMRLLFGTQIEKYQKEIKEFNKKYKNILFPSAEILHEKIAILNRYSPDIYNMTIDKLEKCITKHTFEVREKVIKEIKTIDIRQVIEQEFENYHLELR